ncbi:MAG: bifunctional diaminohydroxyphosphoribosylaminopyrimidine deaminase/5-amino-6-(5-phosphoribosylamino)uracil reductase RibD, partial [Alphaproteobacteria bacterium]|nr:bifunctional diaminohydroxyphosphoribosylaminopyrimidine deaminase/5-amino-6-(5-phosphoribosylamino)uracil reductase RibD [Alphaproteobacteria bacterium]
CVIVKDGRVVGMGRTQDGGRPHAERVAISMAGHETQGATAYVTLEPCAHERPDGNCSQALIAAGVREVYVACLDPDPRTAGKGIEALKEAGIIVHIGLSEEEARVVNQGFFLKITAGRPFITLKIASSLDGRIAAKDGSSQWITGEIARAQGHLLRSRHDAILVGVGTALADNPLLTTRLLGVSHRVVRIVLDTHLRLDPGSKLAQTARDEPLWIFHETDKENKKQELEALGCKLVSINTHDLPAVVQMLAGQGITRLLVEGGAGIHTSFIEAGLYDEIAWFRGGKILGGEGLPVLGGLGIESIAGALTLERRESRALGPDVLDIFVRKE